MIEYNNLFFAKCLIGLWYYFRFMNYYNYVSYILSNIFQAGIKKIDFYLKFCIEK